MGGCEPAGSVDIRMMSREDALEGLLGRWRAGGATTRDLYLAVRRDLYQAARRGIGFITSDTPDEHGVEEVVYEAFCEFAAQDPAQVRSVSGLAWRIGYRRGQDHGRAVIRSREQIRGLAADRALAASIEFSDADARAAARREVLVGYAMECLDSLLDEQRDVVRATVMGRETLSDWALRAGKSHQAASRQCARALRSLARCVESKRAACQIPEGGSR
jgi:DNA-directed RNA polymerase specialized sigma24 family protein